MHDSMHFKHINWGQIPIKDGFKSSALNKGQFKNRSF